MFDEESLHEPPRRYSSNFIYSIRRNNLADIEDHTQQRLSHNIPNPNELSAPEHHSSQTLYKAFSDIDVSESKKRSPLKNVSKTFLNIFKFIKNDSENDEDKNLSADSKIKHDFSDQINHTSNLPPPYGSATLSTEYFVNECQTNTSSDCNTTSQIRVNSSAIKRRSGEARNELLSSKNFDDFVILDTECHHDCEQSQTQSNIAHEVSAACKSLTPENNYEPDNKLSENLKENTSQILLNYDNYKDSLNRLRFSNEQLEELRIPKSNLKKFPTINLSALNVENDGSHYPPTGPAEIIKGKFKKCKKLLNLNTNKSNLQESTNATISNDVFDGDEDCAGYDNFISEDISQTIPTPRHRRKNRSTYKKKIKDAHKRVGSIPIEIENFNASIDTKSILSFRLLPQKTIFTNSKVTSLSKGKVNDKNVEGDKIASAKYYDTLRSERKLRRNDASNMSLISKNSTFRKKLFRSNNRDDHVCYTCKDSFIVNTTQNKFYKIFSSRKPVYSSNSAVPPSTHANWIECYYLIEKIIVPVDQNLTNQCNDANQETVDLNSKSSSVITKFKENDPEMETKSVEQLSLVDKTTNQRLSDCESQYIPTSNDELTDEELMNRFNLPEIFKPFIDFAIIENISHLTFIQDKMSVSQFVEQLNYLDRRYLLLLQWEEIKSGAWLSKNKHENAKNIMQSINHFNRISKFIAFTIISTKKVNKRRKLITFYINACEELYNMKNFNGLQEVLGALSMQPIYRLEETWKGIQPATIKKYDEISTFMDSMNNFNEYREILNKAIGEEHPFIPFMGVFLSDVNAQINYNKVMNSKNGKNSPSIKSKAKSNDNQEIMEAKSNQAFTLSYQKRFSAHQFFKHLSLIDSDYWYRPVSTVLEDNDFDKLNFVETETNLNSYYSSKNTPNTLEQPRRRKKLEKSYSTACSSPSANRNFFFIEPSTNSVKAQDVSTATISKNDSENEKAEYLSKLEKTFSTYQTFIKAFEAIPCKAVCSYLLCCEIPDEEMLYKESCELEPPNK